MLINLQVRLAAHVSNYKHSLTKCDKHMNCIKNVSQLLKQTSLVDKTKCCLEEPFQRIL